MWREEAKEQLGALLRVRELQERAARLGGRGLLEVLSEVGVQRPL